VCTDYRNATATLKEREVEIATLKKDIETKVLTIKLLKDQLATYGLSSIPSNNDVPTDLQVVVTQQRQMIQSLLTIDGKTNEIDKVGPEVGTHV
jgi:hypothetical protein